MSGRRQSARTLRRQDAAIAILCVLSGVGGALADGSPTRISGIDVVLRVAFALILTLAASRASTAAWTGAAAVLVVPTSGDITLFLVALVIFAVAVVATITNSRHRVLGAGG